MSFLDDIPKLKWWNILIPAAGCVAVLIVIFIIAIWE